MDFLDPGDFYFRGSGGRSDADRPHRAGSRIDRMVNLLYVVNFFISGIPLGFIITWICLVSDRSILACMVFHLFVNFMQEKIAMTQETKCVETIVVTIAAAIIVLTNRDMFFETRHVGRLLESLQEQK